MKRRQQRETDTYEGTNRKEDGQKGRQTKRKTDTKTDKKENGQ